MEPFYPAVTITDMKVCSLSNPLGIDKTPVFSWVLSGDKRNKRQTAYKIAVATTRELAAAGTGDVWDSGKVLSDNSCDVLYAGPALASRTAYYWSVEIWDETRESAAVGNAAKFTTGIREDAGWGGCWIGGRPASAPADSGDGMPVPAESRAGILLRKEFTISKTVKEAYAYICGLGFFELTVNGQSPDDSVLNPFTTQYSQTVLYRTFDVTGLIKTGGNAIGVELGNSYYNEIGGVWNWPAAKWRDNPKLLFNLEIRYTDGSGETVASDTSWKVTGEGPVTANSMYYGDTYDARKEQPGMGTVGFDDSAWKQACAADAPAGKLKSQMKAPVRRVSRYAAGNIAKIAGGSYIVTSPEMVAGWIKLTNINEDAGKRITITYGQRLNGDGAVVKWGGADGLSNSWWPDAYIQQDNYIAKGTGKESYEPKFSYKGFQYVQIDGYSGDLTADDLVIYRVSNDVKVISDFETSNELFNALHKMMRAAMRNNFEGEHCDPVLEKNGWLGDANVSLPSMMYNFEMPASLPGFIEVMEDCFHQYGTVPEVVPTADWAVDNSVVWNSIFIYGVRDLARYFGLNSYAAGQYTVMRKFALKDRDEIEANGWVWRDDQLADWVAPVGGSDPDVPYNEYMSEGSGIVGSAFVYGLLEYMADLADQLGRRADAAEYREAMRNIYAAFNDKFYNKDKQIYETAVWKPIGTRTRYRQTSNLVPLAFGLVPPEYADGVAANLIRDIREKNFHLDTGCIGTKYILPILCDYGYPDVAYKIATQTTYPSWGFWLKNGATSTWEMWESTTRSFDHYFLGTYDEWFFTHLAGITDVVDGYKTFTVNPALIGDLRFVKTSIDTVRGKLAVRWSLNDDGTADVDVTVPFGSTADICLPASKPSGIKLDGETVASGMDGVHAIGLRDDKLCVTVGSGSYSFTTETRGS